MTDVPVDFISDLLGALKPRVVMGVSSVNVAVLHCLQVSQHQSVFDLLLASQ